MASLVSPGVKVTVVDESNYAPTAVGTVAYVLLATNENKRAPGGIGIAPGTIAENAEKIWTITSQRDLVTTFGDPIFRTTAGGSPINGDELNEYGLMAAYSSLDVSNTMYVQRADVDLSELSGTTVRPLADPSNGSLWFDVTSTNFGIYEWNYSLNQFTQRIPTVITSTEYLSTDLFTPNVNLGSIGDYAVNTFDPNNAVFYKNYNNSWQLVGNVGWQLSVPAVIGTVSNPVIDTTAQVNINGLNITLAAGSNVAIVASTINSAYGDTNFGGNIRARVIDGRLSIAASDDAVASAVNISNASGTSLSTLGITASVYPAAATQFSPWNNVPEWQGKSTPAESKPTGSIWQKVSALGSGVNMIVKEYNASSRTWNQRVVNSYANVFAASYNLDPTGGGLNISTGTIFNQFNSYNNNTVASYLWRKKISGPTVAIGSNPNPIAPGVGSSFTLQTRPIATSESVSTYSVTIGTGTINGFIQAVAAANIPNVSAGIASNGAITLTHSLGGDMVLIDGVGTPLANVGITVAATNVYDTPALNDTAIVATNWQPLEDFSYVSSVSQPYVSPTNGSLWYYNTPNRVDVMINNGTAWVGYQTLSADIRGYNLSLTNPSGVMMATTAPTKQDNGVDSLVYGDLWLDTSDLENYPKLYRYQSVNGIDQWVLINNRDAVSQDGILFADARWAPNAGVDSALDPIPSTMSMLNSNYVDLDAPSPTLYPRGMLLFNTRAGGYNVKEYKINYFTSANYPGAPAFNPNNPGDITRLPKNSATWVTRGGFELNSGIPNFGRKAPRGIIVAALKAAIDRSDVIREDSYGFNLMVCPGYPELISNMIALNNSRENTAFIVGDTPLRLSADGTSVLNWSNNQNLASSTGEQGLVIVDPYVGIYYPAGQTNDLTGNAVVVPASHAALRTLIRSDNVGYPWLAPAGTRRGLVDNLNSIGYISQTTGQFISVGVNQGLRDVLYENKINPITFLPGNGLVVYGQKTLSAQPSALDRINVARLVNYLRRQVNILARPFLFEPNDPITRNALLATVNSLLTDLVAKRGITDYLSVCDSSNNTPQRIANNELYLDIAIQPTKTAEFIYIPIRLKNPGEIQSGNLASAAPVGAGA
jgi:hypothetical protein